MFCKYCGHELSTGVSFCGNCGKSVEVQANGDSMDKPVSTEKEGEKRDSAHHIKWAPRRIVVSILSTVLAISVTVVGVYAYQHRPGTSKNPIVAKQNADTAITTFYGIRYSVLSAGFIGTKLLVRLNVENTGGQSITADKYVWDDAVSIYDVTTKVTYKLDDYDTTNYRATDASLFSENNDEPLAEGTTYTYDMIFSVSEANSAVENFLMAVPPFGPGEDENHYSHVYVFRLKYIK